MPDLQSCYFCGTPENVQEYAVIPPRFIPDGDEPQSAVLCDQCKTKLLQVVQPLTEQLNEEAASSGPATTNSATAETATPADDSPESGEPGGSGITMSAGDGDRADAAPAPTGDTEPAPETGSNPPGPESESTPPNYRRAMRMLSNREFPLERSEVESMLAGAYDLERHEVDAVLEHALETGRLREEDSEFYQS